MTDTLRGYLGEYPEMRENMEGLDFNAIAVQMGLGAGHGSRFTNELQRAGLKIVDAIDLTDAEIAKRVRDVGPVGLAAFNAAVLELVAQES